MPFVYLLPKTFVLIGFKTFDEGYFRNESCALSSIYTSFCPLCSTCLYFLCSTYLYFLCSTCLYFLCSTCLYFLCSTYLYFLCSTRLYFLCLTCLYFLCSTYLYFLCSTCLYFLCSTYLYFLCSTCLYFLCSTCLYFLCSTCLYFFLSFMFDMPLLGVYKITASSYSLWCLQTFVYDTYYNLTIICHVYRTLILSVDYLYNIFIT
jgi:hypothetical protein